MLSGDEVGIALRQTKEKGQRAEVAIVDEQVTCLDNRQHLVEHRPFLRMAVFAADDVIDDHALRIQRHQGLAWQGSGRRAPQHAQAMVEFCPGDYRRESAPDSLSSSGCRRPSVRSIKSLT